MKTEIFKIKVLKFDRKCLCSACLFPILLFFLFAVISVLDSKLCLGEHKRLLHPLITPYNGSSEFERKINYQSSSSESS